MSLLSQRMPQELKLYVDSENLEPLEGIELTTEPGEMQQLPQLKLKQNKMEVLKFM